MNTLQQEIDWWTQAMEDARKNELAMVCFGVATGLKMAKADYGAKDMGADNQAQKGIERLRFVDFLAEVLERHINADVPISGIRFDRRWESWQCRELAEDIVHEIIKRGERFSL